jgi:Zn-dependent alcohol dehydrogenase
MATMRAAVMLTKKGGPEALETVELPLPEPGSREVRVKVRATRGGGDRHRDTPWLLSVLQHHRCRPRPPLNPGKLVGD